MSTTSSRFKDFDSIVVTNNQFEKFLSIHLSIIPENVDVRKLIGYLKCNGWINYKFNSYSVKPQVNEQGVTTLVILSYTPPALKFI